MERGEVARIISSLTIHHICVVNCAHLLYALLTVGASVTSAVCGDRRKKTESQPFLLDELSLKPTIPVAGAQFNVHAVCSYFIILVSIV